MQAVQTKYNKPWIMQRADPYVYKHVDGTYYFTASVPEYDHIMLRKADTLDGLQNAEEIIIWRKHEKGEMSCHVWAPELHFLFGLSFLHRILLLKVLDFVHWSFQVLDILCLFLVINARC